ncbi:phosphotriesterase [Georgenia sp. SYP-B2076]|uniref:phosphotriesterase family protein n=1 Tax=Georgenia sp. SYP-B2076 TaxID=2495881 RepID=UPI000F8F6F7B|nr:phosphotriesterase-related protein [Georgenia sp. SYP-B2076]
MTVRGPVDSSALGPTLTHEHILGDVMSWWQRSTSPGLDPDVFAEQPVSPPLLWDLKHDPFGNKDNCRLDDVDVAVEEVRRFAALGGSTILEATGLGIGRNLAGLREVSERTGVHIVAGTGFYLEAAQPAALADLDETAVADLILRDIAEGEAGIRPGFIGEIGVGQGFTPAEQKSLAAACLAQREALLPLQIHLPAWFRLGGEVLDFVEARGVEPAHVVLCHMGPSGDDPGYQQDLMRRGAWVQYDMIGAELFYADQNAQCPSDEDNARHIARLVGDGWGDRLLLSSDVFLKSLLRRYGGPGYAHILQYFVPRLERWGIGPETVNRLLVDNPRSVFESL